MEERKFIDSNGAIYDSYDSDYMIFVNRFSDFNCLKNSPFKHIIVIKNEDRIKSFVKFCECKEKTIIYLKKKSQKDILDGIATKDYMVVDYYGKSLKDELSSYVGDIINAKIREVSLMNENKRLIKIAEGDVEDDDEELDMSNVTST